MVPHQNSDGGDDSVGHLENLLKISRTALPHEQNLLAKLDISSTSGVVVGVSPITAHPNHPHDRQI